MTFRRLGTNDGTTEGGTTMSYRQRAGKPSVALWMLVAIGDVALILASVGMVTLIALASVVAVTVATVGTWLMLRRGVPGRDAVPVRGSLATRGSLAMRVQVKAGSRRRV
jgi:hypothetical protein